MRIRRAVAALALTFSIAGCRSGGVDRVATIGPIDRPAMAARVREEFLFCWRAYEKYAWAHDELDPLSRAPHDWYAEPLLVTPVDALDTMLLMHLGAEAAKATAAIEKMSFDRDVSVRNFEVTIRVLGGLLSAYSMTRDQKLLALATDLGTRLLPVFESPTGMPYRNVNLRTGKTSDAKSNPAEIGTLILEFGTLSRLTGNPVYFAKAKKALMSLFGRRSPIGLVGDEIDVETGTWLGRTSHISGGIDSYYEYLLKGSRLFGDADCERMWRQSIAAVNHYLVDDVRGQLWYGQADMDTGKRVSTQYGALDAFFPAVLALGGDVGRARRLQDSGFVMWRLHGVEPDALDYRTLKVIDPGYPLRPEIAESAYYLFHYTKDPKYLRMGTEIFEDILESCHTENGETVLKSVLTKEMGDRMPSYFLAETLKYLYLLFAPEDTLDFDRVVFNTEGHPLQK